MIMRHKILYILLKEKYMIQQSLYLFSSFIYNIQISCIVYHYFIVKEKVCVKALNLFLSIN